MKKKMKRWADLSTAERVCAFWYAQAFSGQNVGKDTAADWTRELIGDRNMATAHRAFKRWLKRNSSVLVHVARIEALDPVFRISATAQTRKLMRQLPRQILKSNP